MKSKFTEVSFEPTKMSPDIKFREKYRRPLGYPIFEKPHIGGDLKWNN